MTVWVLGTDQLDSKAANQALAAERMGAPTTLIAPQALRQTDMTGGLVFLSPLDALVDDVASFFGTPAAQSGRKILDMASFSEQARPLFGLSDMLIFGQTEFAAFLQLDREPDDVENLLPIQPLLTRHNQAAVVILDGIGTVAVWADRTMLVEAFTPEPMSAGIAADCICGVIAAAVAQGIGPERAMTLACAAASLALTNTIPSRPEIEAVINAAGR